ncbi:hypothetical protein [Methylobacterium aquaticum]|uniref:hypothetical protein n=1 Tax=Methylobacterium aquaticum TaxID=270351 RepID=UPI001934425D|nr:hypothetical protein [Methylobacterium aquaticum]
MILEENELVTAQPFRRAGTISSGRQARPRSSWMMCSPTTVRDWRAGRMPGTAALRIVADDETGELESATILEQFGEVPEDFAEQVSGG